MATSFAIEGLLYVPTIRMSAGRPPLSHDHRLAGHPGITKTIKNICRRLLAQDGCLRH